MNKPYFDTENFKLYKADTFRFLKCIEDKSIDMIFADPPYFLSGDGISCHAGKQVLVNKGNWDKTKTIEDKIKYNRKWIKECRRTLKDDGTIWICGTFHNIYAVGIALELEGFSIINNITWQKKNPPPNIACRCFTNSTETIIWARKQLTNKKKGNHYFNYKLMKEMNNNKQMKDVWPICAPKKTEKKFGKHPTQKPIELLNRVILASTKENDLILDPFIGSGTTGIAAMINNRKFIGVDNNSEYLQIAKKRYLDMGCKND